MGKINKKDVKIFDDLACLVADMIARVNAVASLRDIDKFTASPLRYSLLDKDCFKVALGGKPRNLGQVWTEWNIIADFSTTCDTEHCVVFSYHMAGANDKQFFIKHHQDQFGCYDKMPFAIADLNELAGLIVDDIVARKAKSEALLDTRDAT